MCDQTYYINRMRDLPLTLIELVQFTGHKRPAKQIETLRALVVVLWQAFYRYKVHNSDFVACARIWSRKATICISD